MTRVVDRINFRQLNQILNTGSSQIPPADTSEFTALDVDRTINFLESFARVKDFRPELAPWGPTLRELNKTRNEIMRCGYTSAADINRYVELICLSALPFIQEFVRLTTQVNFEKLIGSAHADQGEVTFATSATANATTDAEQRPAAGSIFLGRAAREPCGSPEP